MVRRSETNHTRSSNPRDPGTSFRRRRLVHQVRGRDIVVDQPGPHLSRVVMSSLVPINPEGWVATAYANARYWRGRVES